MSVILESDGKKIVRLDGRFLICSVLVCSMLGAWRCCGGRFCTLEELSTIVFILF